jgi:hypothetical protein
MDIMRKGLNDMSISYFYSTHDYVDKVPLLSKARENALMMDIQRVKYFLRNDSYHSIVKNIKDVVVRDLR